jgi:hypothetical protein
MMPTIRYLPTQLFTLRGNPLLSPRAEGSEPFGAIFTFSFAGIIH